VAVGVEVHADISLGLDVGKGGPARLGVGTHRLEIGDADLQVRHRDLPAGLRRPDVRGVDVLDVERQADPPAGFFNVTQPGSSVPISQPSSRA
jgi:hypothetical protein